jgi:uncharacterized protein (TIGR00290 family)
VIVMTRPKAIVSWSSGKDSAFALHEAREAGEFDIVGILTTVTANYSRVSMHGVREAVLDRQCIELGLPCHKVRIPSPCPNDVYEREIAAAMEGIRAQGVEVVIFGDLFLQDLRVYREQRLAEIGMRAVFPLWMRDTHRLAEKMVSSGVVATITCADPRHVPAYFAGRRFDHGLLDDLPAGVDPCGENGEFHTVVTGGPMFRKGIDTRVGEVVERDGFVFADVALA